MMVKMLCEINSSYKSKVLYTKDGWRIFSLWQTGEGSVWDHPR